MGPARRIVVVSTDAERRARLVSELAAACAGYQLEARDAVAGAGDAAVCVIDLGDDTAPADELPRGPIVIAVARPALAAIVELMQRGEHVVAATTREPSAIAAVVRQVLGEAAPGVAAQLASGTAVRTMVVVDAVDKARCLAAIGGAVEALGLARQRRDAIDQCVDEMVMNALYDAPVDAAGTHVFATTPPRARVRLRTGARVSVSWGHDGTRFAVTVRDAFGSLERATVLRRLHAAQSIESKIGGAGLGLFLMASAASALGFAITPGVATEVTCVFDDRAPELAQLAVIEHAPGTAVRRTPARVRLATRYRVRRAAAATGSIAVVALAAWLGPRVLGHGPPGQLAVTTTAGATIELDGQPVGTAADGTLAIDDLEVGRLYRVTARRDGFDASRSTIRPRPGANSLALVLHPVATLELDSQPSDAIVELAEHPAGTTPMRVTSLTPGTTVTIAFAHPGFRAVTTHVVVPAAGGVQHVVQKLEPSDELVRVHIVSNPPGAAILRDGARTTADRMYAPADLEVEANQVQHITLKMPHYAPLEIPPFSVARGERGVEKVGNLVLGP